jgi:ATP-dependent helicase IRC3
MIDLRPYQQAALDAVFAAPARGIMRPVVALPTGTGKTVLFAHLIAQRPGRILVLVHRDELIRQAYGKLKEIIPTLAVGIVKAEENEYSAPCVVASVQTLGRESRLHRLTWDFETVIVDECHHAIADTYRRILEQARAFTDGGPLTLGVTATPQRGDHVGLEHVFQAIVYQKSLLDMITAGYLADLRAVQIRLKADFHQLHTRAGDFIDSEVENLLIAADAPERIVAAYGEHAPGRKALLFTPTVKFAHAMAAQFCQAGIVAEALDGTTPGDERRAILQRLHTGETRIVTNCGVLTEGFDEPSVDCILVARPTKSTTLFTQMIGRGTRLHPGKTDCVVIDVAGMSTRHDLASVASLTGLPLEALHSGASVREAHEEATTQGARTQIRRETEARAVDLFRRRALHWLQVEHSFTLPLGVHGWLVLTPEGDGTAEQWRATVVAPSGQRDVLASGLSLPYAQGTAEDFARRLGLEALVNPRARWRQQPASEKQRRLLQLLHVSVTPALTMGEASDLINKVKMREAVMRAA